jgi:hypothetical protein
MTDPEWIPITMETKMPSERPFLLCDKYGAVYVGFNAFDFYDLEYVAYWCPFPKFPFPVQGFSSDESLQAIITTLKP